MDALKVKQSDFPKRLTRRALVAAGAAVLLPSHGSAQVGWPSRPIRLVVPFPPGGGNDIIGRAVAAKLSARLGQNVIVENKSGAGGTIGTDFVAKSGADGYTLLFTSTSITTNAASAKKQPFDTVRDLQPIGLVGAGALVVVVSNDMKVTTLRDLIVLARENPKTVNFASVGIGAMNHLAAELFASVAKVQLVHVPYRGAGPAFTDLMAGTVQLHLPSLSAASEFIRAGKMRGLAVTSPQRSPLAPELPTMAEAGLPTMECEIWWGMLGPANMPPAVVQRLNTELNAVLAQPDMRDLLAREGATPRPSTPAAFATLIQTEIGRWAKVIKDANIQIE